MNTSKIFESNWRESLLQNGPYLAYLSLGAAPSESASDGVDWLYFLVVTDRDHQEISSREFCDLESALAALNKQYGHWELSSRSEQKSGDGCSTCQAH